MKQLFFSSLSELVRAVEALPNNSGGDPNSWGDEWSGGSLATAIQLARYGWRAGVEEAGRVVERVATRVVEHDRSQVAAEPQIDYDVAGAAYDPAGYLQGLPECWSRIVEPEARRAVRIALNIEASGFISAKTIAARGYAVSALAMVLQMRGYPVTVDVVFEAGHDTVGVVRVADAESGSQLDLDRMIFGIAHPSMLRHYSRCLFNRSRAPTGSGWGGSMPKVNWKPEGAVDVWLSGVGSWEEQKWSDPEAWILEEYAKQTKRTDEPTL